MAVNRHKLPEIFRPEDARWASRAVRRGEIRRLARGLYSTNLDEPAERLVRRRWLEVAALYYPGAVIVDRSAVHAGPTGSGSLFLDVGPGASGRRPLVLPGLIIRSRGGPGPIQGDTEFAELYISSRARAALDNLRPSRARSGEPRTLKRDELEEWLDRLARTRGDEALNDLRDQARAIAPALNALPEFRELDSLIGALLGTRDSDRIVSEVGRARAAGMGYDRDRLALFETLRGELASQTFPERFESSDPLRLAAFFEAYFSNWIEGTEFEVEEAERIIFEGVEPPDRPRDAHDIRGTFEAILDPRLRSTPPDGADELEGYIQAAHRMVMGGRPEIGPGIYKLAANRAGATTFVHPDLVRGTLREGFTILKTLEPGMARAAFAMFLVTEVHPFADGNSRVARLLMNAELSSASLTRIMIPLSYRGEYVSALKALSQNENPRPLWRMLERAQRWASLMDWSNHDIVIGQLHQSNALVSEGEEDVHLVDPR